MGVPTDQAASIDGMVRWSGRGLPLNKIHHAAYDANLIGINPDGLVHVLQQLMADCRDIDALSAVEAMKGMRIRKPQSEEDRPDRDRVALRFKMYVAAN